MAQQTIVAHFDSRSQALEAREALIDEGVGEDDVHVLPEEESASEPRSAGAYDHARDDGGFWASLAKLFLPAEDRYAYAEGMSRGGATLYVTADTANAEQIAGILDRWGAIDMDERETKWRSEGWTGYAAGAVTPETGVINPAGAGAAMGTTPRAADLPASEGAREDMAAAQADGPMVSEELRAFRRQTDPARPRIRTYAYEPTAAAAGAVPSDEAPSLSGNVERDPPRDPLLDARTGR